MELTKENTLIEIDVDYGNLQPGDHIAAVTRENGKETRKHGIYCGDKVVDVTDVSKAREVDLFEFKGNCILYRINYPNTLSQSPLEIVQRAKNLLLNADCFGDFGWAVKTCECVAVLCKTGKLIKPPVEDWTNLLKFVSAVASASSLLVKAGAKSSVSK